MVQAPGYHLRFRRLAIDSGPSVLPTPLTSATGGDDLTSFSAETARTQTQLATLSTSELSDGSQSQQQPGRITQIVQNICQRNPDWQFPVDCELLSEIPSHQGLGSGTQLGMAVAEALSWLHTGQHLTEWELAALSERGKRSAIGLYGYRQGGFLVDAGHRPAEAIGQLACRLDFPADWRILLVTPPDETGMYGSEEAATFSQLPPMPAETTGKLSRLVLTELLPALQHQEFEAFSAALRNYGLLVGNFFAPYQAGRVLAHSGMEQLSQRLFTDGWHGLAQSSWGPTVAIFAPDAAAADQLEQWLQSDRWGRKCLLLQTQALNTGRTLSTTSHEC